MAASAAFPNYTQIRSRVPMALWHALRAAAVLGALGTAAALWLVPDRALFVFWRLVVPVLPLVFFVAPGLWRNACPLAAVNQLPRLAGVSRGLPLPDRWKEYGYVVGIALFFVLAGARKVVFHQSGVATALLILGAMTAAFVGGVLFRGKSGYCSTFCPLLPVQRLYGQTPFVTVPNSHCRPCVGCTKHCYDFNPHVAYLADQYDKDRYHASYRRAFAAAFPGFVLAFYLVPDPAPGELPHVLAGFAVCMAGSLAAFFLLDSFVKLTPNRLTALFGALALNVYYAFSAPALAEAALGAFGPAAWTGAGRALQGVVVLLSLYWIYRTHGRERQFVREVVEARQVKVSAAAATVLQRARPEGHAEVTIAPDDRRYLVAEGRSLLEVAEANQLPLQAGCRMGVCGADPVAVLGGMDQLSPPSDDERATLARLGLADTTRLACSARVHGCVRVALRPEPRAVAAAGRVIRADFDREIRSVVIVGAGIAGVTAADHVRRRHPECDLHVVGRERHPLYNRMGIAQLVHGRSAMAGLYLQPEGWYDAQRITLWLNTHATRIDTARYVLVLATGEELPYDRLVLAMGSRSAVPSVPGMELPGVFALREADDAMAIREYVQRSRCRRALVAGGGLLGLEAAYALTKLGLPVTVFERSRHLLRRQLDARAAELVADYVRGLGIQIITEAELGSATGRGRFEAAVLADGRVFDGDLLLVCAGVTPNVELARDAGLSVGRGVRVGADLRTSVRDIYAAGDVAEFDGEVHGLWPVAVEQAEIAAENALGGHRAYRGSVASTLLKVAGADLASVGRVTPRDGDEVIVLDEPSERRYRRLLVREGRIAGAVLLGAVDDARLVAAAAKDLRDVAPLLPRLRAGDLKALAPGA